MEKYVFKPYNPIFPKLYATEVHRLREIIGQAYSLEHVGSTAITNLGGKGIIDILALAPETEMTLLSKVVQKRAGYDFKPAGGGPDRLFHQQDLPDELEGVRRYHLHITFPDSEQHRRFISFREYLKTHPEYLQKYAEVKQLAVRLANGDRDTYNHTKQPIIDEIIQRAYKEIDFDLNK